MPTWLNTTLECDRPLRGEQFWKNRCQLLSVSVAEALWQPKWKSSSASLDFVNDFH